jgi:hypothetical protein
MSGIIHSFSMEMNWALGEAWSGGGKNKEKINSMSDIVRQKLLFAFSFFFVNNGKIQKKTKPKIPNERKAFSNFSGV